MMTSHEELGAQRKYLQSGSLTLSYLDYGGETVAPSCCCCTAP